MSKQTVFYVGSTAEVAHHARPLQNAMDVEVAEPREVAKVARAGDLAIFYSEHFRRFRELIPALRERGCATLYAMDGILEWRNAWENRAEEPASPFTMRPVLSDKVACIGASQSRILAHWGNRGRVEIVGIPRLDLMAGRKLREPSDTLRLLIMSAKWPGFTPQQEENALRAFRDLRDWLADHPVIGGRRVEPVWRITRGLDEALSIENTLNDLTGRELANVLPECDAVVSTPSTAMLEGMLQGLPVAMLEYNQCPSLVPPVWQITAPEHISQVMAELAEPSPVKLDHQRVVLADSLAFPGRATERMVQLIQKMLRHAQASIAAGGQLHFPEQILEYQKQDSLDAGDVIRHNVIYADRDEFNEEDPTVLQIQLIDARREIEQREGEIAQLKSELDEAHQIFEQIHRHPIAGPVVRIRQRIMDWLSSARRRQADPPVDATTEQR